MTDLQTILQKLAESDHKKGTARAWDIAGKILIPVVIGLGAWGVRLEIRTSALEKDVQAMPPKWMKDDITEMKADIKDIRSLMR